LSGILKHPAIGGQKKRPAQVGAEPLERLDPGKPSSRQIYGFMASCPESEVRMILLTSDSKGASSILIRVRHTGGSLISAFAKQPAEKICEC
jgi:hypothetical protein